MTQPELTQEFLLRLSSFVARRSPPGVDPQDIVQDVVTRLWSQPQRPQGKRLHGWLFTAARNAVIDAYRRPTSRDSCKSPLPPLRPECRGLGRVCGRKWRPVAG